MFHTLLHNILCPRIMNEIIRYSVPFWGLAAAVSLSPENSCWVEAGWWTTDEKCIYVPHQDNSMLNAGLLAELKDPNRQRTSLSVTTLCVDVAVYEEACLKEREKKGRIKSVRRQTGSFMEKHTNDPHSCIKSYVFRQPNVLALHIYSTISCFHLACSYKQNQILHASDSQNSLVDFDWFAWHSMPNTGLLDV